MTICGRFRHILLGSLALIASLNECAAQSSSVTPVPPRAITSVERFYATSDKAFRSGIPVRIEGVVLYADADWSLLWIQDETGRLFLALPSNATAPQAKTRVVVSGTTKFKNGSRGLDSLQFEYIGKATLPPARTFAPDHPTDHTQLSGRVKLTGLVVEVKRSQIQPLRLTVVYRQTHQVRVYVRKYQEVDLAGLLGSEVELAGCWDGPPEGTSELDSSRVSHRIFVPDMADVSVYKSGPTDPFTLPIQAIEEINRTHEADSPTRMVRLQGTVVAHPASDNLVLENGNAQIPIQLKEASEFDVGWLVEVVGCLWPQEDGKVVLEHAIIRRSPADSNQQHEQESPALPTLRTALALNGLTRALAKKSYPVEIQGVVTYYDAPWRVLFVHDRQRGFFVQQAINNLQLEIGDQVSVRGVSDPGGFAPMVVATEIEKLPGKSDVLPSPQSISFGRLFSGMADSQRITLKGVINTVEAAQENLILNLSHSTDANFEAVICGAAGLQDTRNWVGSHVTLEGVCGIKSNASLRVLGIYVHVADIRHVTFLFEAPVDPYAIATTPISYIRNIQHTGNMDAMPRLLKTSGVVTYSDSSGLVAIQDHTQGCLIRFKSKETPRVNDVIELLGEPVGPLSRRTLHVSDWRTTGSSAPHPIKEITQIGDIENSELDGQLVAVEGVVLRNNASSTAPGLTLQSDDGLIFTVELAKPTTDASWNAIEEQSVVRVQGVLDIRSDAWERIQSIRLLCPISTPLQTVRPAPWWTFQRAATIVSCLAGLVVFASIWAIALRTTIAKQTDKIKQESAAHHDLAEKHRTLIDNAGELIFSITRAGRFVSVNPATERAFDAPHKRLLDESISQQLESDSATALDQVISRLSAEEPHAVLEITTLQGLTLETAVRLEPQETTSDEIQCIARDVSERHRLEGQIRHMQKMESVGQLAAGVAHDYNNLLTVVRMNSELLLEFSQLNQEDARSVEMIRDAADHAAALTQQLLVFSRRQKMNATVVSIGDLIVETASMLAPLVGEGIHVQLNVPDEVPTIHADRTMIQQVIMNLALNARDAMPDGGTLTIDVQAVTITAAAAAADIQAMPGKFIQISVADTGMGIDAKDLPNIFEPFFTTKDVGKGTGLGLSSAFGIVKQHAGWMTVETQPETGSRFSLFLPIDRAANQSMPSSELPSQETGQNTILLVEDDSSVRLSISQKLERAGYRVVHSVNGVEGLEFYRRTKHKIDLVITDVVMPGGMTGAEMAQQIQASSPGIPVIYCTGYSDELTNRETFSPSERLLRKPFEGSRLLQTVRELLNGADRTFTSTEPQAAASRPHP